MGVVEKIAKDWEENQAASDMDVWGSQWGGEPYYRQVVNFTRPLLSGDIVEIGCGGGKFTRYLTTQGDVIAFDVHQEAVEETKRNAPEARVWLTPGDCIPLEDGSADIVCSFDTMQHLPPPLVHRYIKEAHRVARKMVVLTLPNLTTTCGQAKFNHAVERKVWERLYEYGYMNYYHPEQVKYYLRMAHWAPRLVANVGYPRPRDMLIVGYKPHRLEKRELAVFKRMGKE